VDSEIYFNRISAEGVMIGPDIRVTYTGYYSRYPHMVWTGSEYGVSWLFNQGGAGEIYFARLSGDGTKLGSDLRVTYAPEPAGPINYNKRLAWTGSEFGLAWDDNRNGSPYNMEVYFTRISASGVEIGDDIRITNKSGDAGSTNLAWTGSEFGLSWCDDRDGNREIYFLRLSSSGAEIGSETRITFDSAESVETALSWTGSEFGLVWRDNREGNNEIYFTRLSASGVKLDPDLRITSNAAESLNPRCGLVWTGSEFGVSWDDDRDGNREIYFARIGGVCP